MYPDLQETLTISCSFGEKMPYLIIGLIVFGIVLYILVYAAPFLALIGFIAGILIAIAAVYKSASETIVARKNLAAEIRAGNGPKAHDLMPYDPDEITNYMRQQPAYTSYLFGPIFLDMKDFFIDSFLYLNSMIKNFNSKSWLHSSGFMRAILGWIIRATLFLTGYLIGGLVTLILSLTIGVISIALIILGYLIIGAILLIDTIRIHI